MAKLVQENNSDEKIKPARSGEKLLLHACCGPCSLQPYEILKNAGWDITIMYSNSNIYPHSEFERRFCTLNKWCNDNKIPVIKDKYDEKEWESRVLKYGEEKQFSDARKIRCGECYLVRLEHAAKYAKENRFEYIGSTLAVSPYQYNDVLEEKLNIVCEDYNLKPVFMDFRPFYSKATKQSRDLDMYRQKYCGCEFSYRESIEQFKRTKNKKFLRELEAITQS